MKCPYCRGSMKKVKDSISEDSVDFYAYECISCGERVVDMEQLKELSKKYRKLKSARSVKFSKWGNSIAIRILNDFVTDLKISDGKEGFLVKDSIKIFF